MQKSKSYFGMDLLFAVLFAVCFLLSASTMPLLDATKPGVIPDIMLALCCVCPLFEGRTQACLFALVAGTLTDIFVMPPFHFSPVLFVLCALYVPKISSVFSNVNVACAAASSLVFLVLRAVTGTFYILSRYSGVSVSDVFAKCILPEFAVNFVCVIAVYFAVSFLVRCFHLSKPTISFQ